jgi:glucokinase
LARSHGRELSGEEVARRASEGDQQAREILKTAGEALGAALASVANALNPDAIVVGGKVVHSGEDYVEAMRRTFGERTMLVQRQGVRLMVSDLEDAGLLGAAAMVFDRSAVQR